MLANTSKESVTRRLFLKRRFDIYLLRKVCDVSAQPGRRKKILALLLSGMLLHISSLLWATSQDQSPRQTGNDRAVLQFSENGHVLGFDKKSVFLAGLDHALRIDFDGGRPVHPVSSPSADAAPGTVPFNRVTYRGVWEGIDIIFTATAGGIAESTYVVHPGGNPADISLHYNVPVSLTSRGELRTDFNSGYMTESAPVAWQEIGGQRHEVNVKFVVRAERQVGFYLEDFSPSFPVYIDPVYQWHSFYGSTAADDLGRAIATDDGGNLYITGKSNAAWNGPGDVAPLNAFSGDSNMYVLKLDNAGVYQWHTFYGTWGENYGYAIGIGSDGAIYLSGTSQYDWNGPGDTAPLNAHAGSRDFVIVKLGADGSYQWHTFLGSTSNDYNAVLALDTADNVYIAGSSEGTWGTPLNPYSAEQDIVIAKLNNNGILQWHTFLGSTGYEELRTIDVDADGNVYGAGQSFGSWTGPAGEAPRNAYAGTYDLCVVKLNSSGGYQWHTFLGSGSDQYANAVKADANGQVYLAGNSLYIWNGPGAVAPLHATGTAASVAGGVVIAKLDSDGDYLWHTFYGYNSGNDSGEGLVLDGSGYLYVTGASRNDWGETVPAPVNDHSANINDIYILKLDTDGGYQWHSFYGSSGSDYGYGIALDTADNLFVTGMSQATWTGPGDALPLNEYSGSLDSVVIKAHTVPVPSDDLTPTAAFSAEPESGPAPLDVSFTDTSVGDPVSGWTWYFGDEDFSGSWTQMTAAAEWMARSGWKVTSQPDGGLVLIGGDDVREVWRSTDQGSSWMQMTNATPWSKRGGHTVVSLTDASIVVIGGDDHVDNRNDVYRSRSNGAFWRLQTSNGGWAKRSLHSAVAMPDGRIVIMGGYDNHASPPLFMNDVWQSNDNGVTWTLATASPGWTARYDHSSVVLPDGSIVLMGGVDAPSYTLKNDVWRSTDGGETWTEMTASAGWTARHGHSSAALPDGSILLMGGQAAPSYEQQDDVWRSTDNGATWSRIAEHAEWAPRYLQGSVSLPDGSIALVGGYTSSYQNDVWLLETAGSTVQNPSHQYPNIGTYRVTLQAYNDYGADRAQQQVVAEPTVPGDVDKSGVIDLADVIRSLQVVTGLSGYPVNKNADINEDGKIGMEEVIYDLSETAK